VASQNNRIPNFGIPLVNGGVTQRDWYFFWDGLYRGLPPANVAEPALEASPMVYSALIRGSLIVQGGAVSLVEFSRDGLDWYDTGQTQGMFPLSAADQLRITYSSAPNLTFVPT
jgi:hypothetical protein